MHYSGGIGPSEERAAACGRTHSAGRFLDSLVNEEEGRQRQRWRGRSDGVRNVVVTHGHWGYGVTVGARVSYRGLKKVLEGEAV